MADLTTYLNREWHPVDYHCWSLVRDYYSRELNIDLPPVAIDARSIREVLDQFRLSDIYQAFNRVETPCDHDVVLFINDAGLVSHCGIFVGGKILHNLEPFGIAWQRLLTLRTLFPTWTYWRHGSRSPL